MVLELYAMDAFQRSDFAEAVSLLNRALSSPALADEHRAALASGYQQARGHLGDELPALDVAIASASAAPVGSTLFVIARPLGGGMPYAVVRRPAGVLPTTIRLDDAVSMNPALPLSSAPAVEVVVRLSRAGTPMAHPGDWEWRSGEVSLEGLAAPVQLSAELRPPEPQASG
jgi:cytochrome c-type biogenesis protein CcmH